jgi:hypothetical protein
MYKFLAFFLTSSILLSACGSNQLFPPPMTLTPEETGTGSGSAIPTIDPTQATLQLAVHLPQTRTGLTEIDPIIDAVLAHDYPGIKEMTSYLEIGCVMQEGMGGPPPCAEGESEGTRVMVVPFLGPEGHYQHRAEYENWDGPDVIGLLAVYRTGPGTWSDPAYPAGDFGLVFLLPGGAETLTLQVTGDQIIRYDYGLGGFSPAELEDKASEIILPFNFQPIPTQVPWVKFYDPQGRFSFSYPPLLPFSREGNQESWLLGDQIRVEVLPFETSWITCFDKSLGDCPFAESDEQLQVNGYEARKISGYIGAVGGNIPQEFQTFIFSLEDRALVITVYALPIGLESTDMDQVWPLQGVYLEFFQRTVDTVQIHP